MNPAIRGQLAKIASSAGGLAIAYAPRFPHVLLFLFSLFRREQDHALFPDAEHDPRQPLRGPTGVLEVKDHTRFIAEYPAVMPGGSNHEIPRSEVQPTSIVHLDGYLPRNDVSEMRNLAALCAYHRLDML
jgi:hypothetical protein